MSVTEIVLKNKNMVMLVDTEDLPKLEGLNLYAWTRRPDLGLWYGLYSTGRKKKGRIHRLLTNAPEGMVVDHINGNALDNRKCNLRIVTQTENQANQHKHLGRKRNPEASSHYRGVHYCTRSRGWKAQIQKYGKKYSLGTFTTEDNAAQAYNFMAYELYGEVCPQNIA